MRLASFITKITMIKWNRITDCPLSTAQQDLSRLFRSQPCYKALCGLGGTCCSPEPQSVLGPVSPRLQGPGDPNQPVPWEQNHPHLPPFYPKKCGIGCTEAGRTRLPPPG